MPTARETRNSKQNKDCERLKLIGERSGMERARKIAVITQLPQYHGRWRKEALACLAITFDMKTMNDSVVQMVSLSDDTGCTLSCLGMTNFFYISYVLTEVHAMLLDHSVIPYRLLTYT